MACWDILGKATGLPVCVAARRALRRRVRALPRDLAGARRRRWPRSVARYRAEGYRKFQLKVGGDPDDDIERIRAVRAKLQAGRRAGRRRQHRLADARGRARGARGARRRRLHRAALPHVRGVPRRSAGAPTIRSCSTRRSTRIDVLLRAHADGAMDVVNLKITKVGGLTQGAADPRPVRLARHRDDDRGHLGRRHHDRRHRAPRAHDARGAALLGHRLQQLRHRQHRRGRAEAEERPDGGQQRARPRRAPASRRCSGARSSR